MTSILRRFALLGVTSLAVSAFYGCGPVEWQYAAYATAAPPAPYVEVVDAAPGPDYVWINGYWWWDGAQYVWSRGYWGVPPSRGYVWVAPGWVRDGGRYVFVHGRWASPGRAIQPRYVHPRPTVRVQPGVRYQTVRPAVRVRQSGRPTVRVRR